jgi:hypothetical protein
MIYGQLVIIIVFLETMRFLVHYFKKNNEKPVRIIAMGLLPAEKKQNVLHA